MSSPDYEEAFKIALDALESVDFCSLERHLDELSRHPSSEIHTDVSDVVRTVQQAFHSLKKAPGNLLGETVEPKIVAHKVYVQFNLLTRRNIYEIDIEHKEDGAWCVSVGTLDHLILMVRLVEGKARVFVGLVDYHVVHPYLQALEEILKVCLPRLFDNEVLYG